MECYIKSESDYPRSFFLIRTLIPINQAPVQAVPNLRRYNKARYIRHMYGGTGIPTAIWYGAENSGLME